VLNRTGDTLSNVTLDLATVGDMRLCERPQPFSLAPHKSVSMRASVKVSSTENGVIYGVLTYEVASGKPNSTADPIPHSINLADIHLDVMDYIKKASCEEAEFRKMWAEFEWENKVLIMTSIKDPVEYLDHLLSVTNMNCLTPREHMKPNCRFLAANLYAKSIFGEDALLNLSVERETSDALSGAIRIRAKTQGIALSLGDKVTLKQKGK